MRFLWIFLLFAFQVSWAQQTGDIDTNFRISQNGDLIGTVYKVVVQPDQKVIAFGNFNGIGNWISPYLLRFFPDGKVDTTFKSPFLPGQQQFSVSPFSSNALLEGRGPQLLPDGNYLVSGQFNLCGTDSIKGIVRLQSDGKVDTSFRPYKTISTIGWQLGALSTSSGKVYSTYSDGTNSTLLRLLANGDLDPTFHGNSPINFNYVHAFKISALANGKYFLHFLDPCFGCPQGGGVSYSGNIFDDTNTSFDSQTGLGWRWMQEDSLQNLYSINFSIFSLGHLIRYNVSLDSLYTSDTYNENFSAGQLLDHNEMMMVDQNIFPNYSTVQKVIHIDSQPLLLPEIGRTNDFVYSLARNDSNQVYLAGDFTRYKNYDSTYAKLIRIHNVQDVVAVKPKLEMAVRLFPNPSFGNRCVLETKGQTSQISVMDLTGKQLSFSTRPVSANQIELVLPEDVSSKICFVHLQNEQTSTTIKWVIYR